MQNVTVIGLGYIGLPTCVALATRGVQVVGVDVDTEVVRQVNAGQVPFVEPDLAVAVAGAVGQGMLEARHDLGPSDAFVVAVPTPFLPDRTADLSHVRDVAEAVAPHLRGGELVILESTSPPGTTERMSRWILDLRPDLALAGTDDGRPEISVAHCPERVLPGRIMIEIVANDRVVGGLTPACADRAAALYEIFCQGEIFRTDARTAELSKLVENSFRDVNIAFANELAGVCDHLGLDVWRVIELANRHPRVDVLRPGPGVGGHCIAVDPWFVVSAAPGHSRLIRTAREVNDGRPAAVVRQVLGLLPDRAPGVLLTVAVLGLAFKADVDDLRGSPAVSVASALADEMVDRGRLMVVEPYITRLPPRLADAHHVVLCELDEALEASDVVVLLVDHRQFGSVRPDVLRGRPVVDTRGAWRSGPSQR